MAQAAMALMTPQTPNAAGKELLRSHKFRKPFLSQKYGAPYSINNLGTQFAPQ